MDDHKENHPHNAFPPEWFDYLRTFNPESAAPMTRDDVERQYRNGIHIASGLPRETCPCGFCAKHRFGFNSGDGAVIPALSPAREDQLAELYMRAQSLSRQYWNWIENAHAILAPTPTGQQALSDAAAPQAVALTDEQIKAEWFKAAGHGISSGRLLDDAKRFAHAILAATLAQAQKEPDCWAILTPNGSRLVSAEEAKGRRDAYPLYREAPQSSPSSATADAPKRETTEISLYYMRDDHTFKRLKGSVEEMLVQCMEEYDAGFTAGMLCTKSIPGIGNVHAGTDREHFKNSAHTWLAYALSRSDKS